MQALGAWAWDLITTGYQKKRLKGRAVTSSSVKTNKQKSGNLYLPDQRSDKETNCPPGVGGRVGKLFPVPNGHSNFVPQSPLWSDATANLVQDSKQKHQHKNRPKS